MTGALLAPVLAAVLLAASGESPVRRALVVGHNGGDHAGLAPLQYADDDAVLWTEVLQRLGVATILLTVPDADTARLGAEVLARARPPTGAALDEAVEQIARAASADRAAGRQVDVLFVYVGHGRGDEAGRSYLTLLGDQLDRAALYGRVVDRLGADFVHVIVDACRAAGVVGSRGEPDAEVLRQVQATLEREQLARRPNVGALFAESDDGETHEWSRIRAGVFSHAVRSGLLGGADVNHDERVEYSELDAFVAAALAGVGPGRIQLSVHSIAPAQDPRRPLVARGAGGPDLELAPGAGLLRASIEDEHGVRLADLHRVRGEPLALVLPRREAYWIRGAEGEALVRASELARGLPVLRPGAVVARGSAETQLRAGLFAVAFGRSFYEGYMASSALIPVRFEPSGEGGASEAGATHRRGRVELGLEARSAPLDGDGPGFGPAAAWRRPIGAAWALGAKASYAYFVQRWNGAALHALGVDGIVELRGHGRVAPLAQAGLGWAALIASRPGALQGDAAMARAHLEAGGRWNLDAVALRLAASTQLSTVRVDQALRLQVGWALSLGLEP